jgi:carbonic anhydrase/acetyltransferase-like protein (isoleucine patch superfamily)
MFEKLNYLDFNEAIKKSFELTNTTLSSEFVSINFAINRVVSEDILCVKNLPAFDNSAMDGFAFKASDAGQTLKIKRAIFAGDKDKSSDELLEKNECYKIMTGAKVPKDADTIIAIENCINVTEDSVTIPVDIKKGSNLRLEAEELKISDILIKKGEKINSSHIALLASQGVVMVERSYRTLINSNEIKIIMALIKSVRGFTPQIGENCYLADNATIIGDVVMGRDCSIWFNAVLRGDVNSIRIGDRVNIQDGTVLHTLYEKSTVEIGNDVSIGIGSEVPNKMKPNIYSGGLATIGENSVIPGGVQIGKNTAISGVTSSEDYIDGVLASGETLIKAGDRV